MIVNKFFLKLLPVYFGQVTSQKSSQEVLLILDKIISRENTHDHPYKGSIKNGLIKFSKRDIASNLQSELLFIGKITQTRQQVIIHISSRYKILPMLAYLLFMFQFTMIQWPIDHPFKLMLPLLPYAVVLIKIKRISKKVLNDLQSTLGVLTLTPIAQWGLKSLVFGIPLESVAVF